MMNFAFPDNVSIGNLKEFEFLTELDDMLCNYVTAMCLVLTVKFIFKSTDPNPMVNAFAMEVTYSEGESVQIERFGSMTNTGSVNPHEFADIHIQLTNERMKA